MRMSIYDYDKKTERIFFEAEVAELASPLRKRLAYTIGKLREAARNEQLKGSRGVHYFVSELLQCLWDIFQEVSQMEGKYRQAVLGEIANTLAYELNEPIGLLIKKEAYGYTGLLEVVKRLLEENWEAEQAFQKEREERKRKEEEERRRKEEEERKRREEEERKKKEEEEKRRAYVREALLKGEMPAIKNRMQSWYLREEGGILVLEVPKWLVPHAIGKGGQTVKALQSLVGRKIRVVGVDEPPPSKIDVEFPWR
uniref:K Homology domain-containing protein n=1 Tax=Thermocrinis ruber TaxID=75906 RepID=A0A7C5WZM3_9AQUI